MGTVFSVDVRRAPANVDVDAALDAFFDDLRDVDRRFSPFRPDSEISRIAAGVLREEDASQDVRWVLGACDDLARSSGGAFDARRHRPDGRLDPSGFVKGWSVDEAAYRRLDSLGIDDYAVNAGGDVLARGEPEPGRPWRVGIRHPERGDAVAAVLLVRDLAVATSGRYERGDHLRDPRRGGKPAAAQPRDAELASLTVVGPSLTWADAYATAAFPMGLAGLTWIERRAGYGALAVTADERVVWTPFVDALLEPLSSTSHGRAVP